MLLQTRVQLVRGDDQVSRIWATPGLSIVPNGRTQEKNSVLAAGVVCNVYPVSHCYPLLLARLSRENYSTASWEESDRGAADEDDAGSSYQYIRDPGSSVLSEVSVRFSLVDLVH